MQNARLDEAQAGIKIAWRNINNLRYADDIILMAESEELCVGSNPGPMPWGHGVLTTGPPGKSLRIFF